MRLVVYFPSHVGRCNRIVRRRKYVPSYLFRVRADTEYSVQGGWHDQRYMWKEVMDGDHRCCWRGIKT